MLPYGGGGGGGGRFGPLIVAIEQPTTAARATVFAAKTSEMLTYHQKSIELIRPQEGWVEQDPLEILNAVLECIEVALDNLRKLDIKVEDIVTVGLCNQRETVVVWDSKTGQPLHNAIVWLDIRSDEVIEKLHVHDKKAIQEVQDICGLPLSSYFSAPKLYWLLKNCTKIKDAIVRGTCKVGTIDSWLIWNLTGGTKGGMHVTDVTNASRTMLMNLTTLSWDQNLCNFFNIPRQLLPSIKSSSEVYGYIFTGSLTGVPISGGWLTVEPVVGFCKAVNVGFYIHIGNFCLGDQQAALVGQMCLGFGHVKCTYGIGTFLMCNTGTSLIKSKNGLLTTVAYKFGPNAPPVYALEGSGRISGMVLDWLKNEFDVTDCIESETNDNNGNSKSDQHKLSSTSSELLKKLSYKAEDLDPDDEGTVYFTPAFDGLYGPYWNRSAQSVICGISPTTSINNLSSSASRSLAFQTRDMLEALGADLECFDRKLLVDGSWAMNSSLMQLQADICGIPIVRPIMPESSALGAAMVAGSADGIKVWPRVTLPSPSDFFFPTTNEDERDIMYSRWNMAVERSTRILPKKKKNDGALVNRVHSSLPVGLFLISSFLLLHMAKSIKQ